jgi:hypothetical protein
MRVISEQRKKNILLTLLSIRMQLLELESASEMWMRKIDRLHVFARDLFWVISSFESNSSLSASSCFAGALHFILDLFTSHYVSWTCMFISLLECLLLLRLMLFTCVIQQIKSNMNLFMKWNYGSGSWLKTTREKYKGIRCFLPFGRS